MDFGSILRGVRESRKMTQEQTAQALDLSAHTISTVENGRTRPQYDILTTLMPVMNFTKEEYLALYYAKEKAMRPGEYE